MGGWPNNSRLSLSANGVGIERIQDGQDDSVEGVALSDDEIDEAASRRPSRGVQRPDIRSHVLEPLMDAMVNNLRQTKAPVVFNDSIRGCSRNVAAKCFFDLLVLKTRDEVRIDQEQLPGGYGPITVSIA